MQRSSHLNDDSLLLLVHVSNRKLEANAGFKSQLSRLHGNTVASVWVCVQSNKFKLFCDGCACSVKT